MSRQMACQLSGPQLIDWAQKAITLAKDKDGKYQNFGELLDAEVPDPKEKIRMSTSIVVLSELSEEKMTAHDVRQVIRWRNEKGEPGPIEIQYNKAGAQKRAVKKYEQQRLQSLRDAVRMFGPGILFR